MLVTTDVVVVLLCVLTPSFVLACTWTLGVLDVLAAALIERLPPPRLLLLVV